MKTSSLLLVLGALATACGTSGGGDDSGIDSGGNDSASGNDAAKDAASDSSTNDASPTDSGNPSDASFGDGGLGAGSPCDPKDNLCLPTLLCCSEPTHNFDGGPLSAYMCETPQNGKCPLQP